MDVSFLGPFKHILHIPNMGFPPCSHAGRTIRTARSVSRTVLLLGVLVLCAGGCSRLASDNVQTRDGVGLGCERPFVHRVFDRKIKDARPGTNVRTATIHLEYVEVGGLENGTIQKKINQRLQKVAGVLTSYDGTEDVFLSTKKASIHGDLISIVFEGTYYAHGAAGAVNFLECVNLNMNDGNDVTFGELFLPGYAKRINALAQQWFASHSIVSRFAGVGEEQKYYLDDVHLYLCFSEYEVAAGCEGAVTVAIRLRDIKDVIRKNGLLAFVL